MQEETEMALEPQRVNLLWNIRYHMYASPACSHTAAHIKNPGEQQFDLMKQSPSPYKTAE